MIELACAQDVGKAMNPDAVVGQIQGGSAQGMGLALMEEIVVSDGAVRMPARPHLRKMKHAAVRTGYCDRDHARFGSNAVNSLPFVSIRKT